MPFSRTNDRSKTSILPETGFTALLRLIFPWL